ncbi:ferredoxin [Rhodococcus sp. USK13]|uniref:ferredoxin n=1 Tax=Rhodococcus sp. USK13 TaxID=2806442 RepID=UPI001BCD3834|nr:ferredoxin [Rhodococcus sp. USK13]
MRIKVDFGKCTGLGICESIAPGYFEVNDDGDLEVLRDEVDDDDLELLEQSVAGCPTIALSIER